MSNLKSALLAAAAVVALGAGTAKADILVAMNGPITGSVATFGDQMKRGAEMFVKDINDKGGLLGQKLQLIIGDDACDPKQAVAVANQAASKKVAAVFGHFCSGSSIPASNVYNEENVLQISPASTNPDFTERGLPYVFRTCGRDDQQGPTAAGYIEKNFKGKNVAIIHDKTAYGKGLADETKKALNARNIQEVMYEAITAGEKDYSALVSKLKQAKVDLIYLGGYHPEAGLIIRQAREQGLNATLMSGDALVSQELWAITGPAGEGTLMTFSPDPAKNPENKDIVAKFEATGQRPEGYTLYTYGAMQAWSAAVQKVGSIDTRKVAEELKKGKFDTVLGSIGFDKKGDVTAPGYIVYKWHDGKYDYAE
ncbi:MAG: branched-chain amino acid ABC transporter substrate-binding protein [Rhodospirillales bacterium]|nr:branched-chain amino acid ABC transporter substrate-binding protein [Rhodospirillales bacterium]